MLRFWYLVDLFLLATNIYFIIFQLIQKETCVETEETQDATSESDNDDGEDASESEGSNSSSDDDQGDEEGESSDQRTDSPKVDIVGCFELLLLMFWKLQTCIFVGYGPLT